MTLPLAGVVLAAGAGTRLRPLTDLRPKALCPVDNVPLVDLALARVGAVAADVAVNAHHHADQLAAHLSGREQLAAHLGGRVHLSVERPRALGTAGAIGQLRDWLDGRDAIVANADAWTDADPTALLEGWDGERIRLLVVEDPDRGDFGRYRFAGLSLLPWRDARQLEPVPTGLYEVCWAPALAAGRVELVPVDARFVDCGTPADYLLANLLASDGRSVVAPGARVEGEVVRSVVWPGATVRRGERLVECIRASDDVTVEARLPPRGRG